MTWPVARLTDQTLAPVIQTPDGVLLLALDLPGGDPFLLLDDAVREGIVAETMVMPVILPAPVKLAARWTQDDQQFEGPVIAFEVHASAGAGSGTPWVIDELGIPRRLEGIADSGWELVELADDSETVHPDRVGDSLKALLRRHGKGGEG